MNSVSVALIISFLVNLCLTCLKLVIGFIFKSKALTADGLHSFSDLITDVMAFVGSKVSRRPPDKEHPFGHGKLEYLTSMIIGIIVLGLGLSLIFNSHNSSVKPSWIVIITTIFTIMAKYLLSFYLIKKGNKLKNMILISSGRESKADVISSVVVLISSILVQFASNYPYLIYADSIATIIVGLLIIKTGFTILKESISIILGKQEDDQQYLKELKKIILTNENIIKIDNMIMLKYGPYYSLNLEVLMPNTLSLKDAHEIVHKVEKEIKKYDRRITFIMIHINPWSQK